MIRSLLVVLSILMIALTAGCFGTGSAPPAPDQLLQPDRSEGLDQQQATDEDVIMEEPEVVVPPVEPIISDVICNKADESLSFSVYNPTVTTWLIAPDDGPSAFSGELEGQEEVLVLINEWKVNTNKPQFSLGRRLFGPEDRFADNCGGVQALAPGERMSCTLLPIKINLPTALSRGDNYIEVQATGSYERFDFTCS